MDDEHELRMLRHRVGRLEQLVVRLTCWAAGLLLVVGMLLDYVPVREGADEQDVAPRLLTAGFGSFGFRNDEGNADASAVTAGIGYLGLLLVTLIVLWLLAVIAAGSAGSVPEWTGRVLRIALTLVLIGTTVAGLIALVCLSSDEYDVGWGVVVFAAGGGLCLTLLSRDLRRTWDPTLAA